MRALRVWRWREALVENGVAPKQALLLNSKQSIDFFNFLSADA